MDCGICGEDRELVDAIVEGSMIKVCGECSKHGNVITISGRETVHEVKELSKEEDIEIVVDNYSEIVKVARQKLGIRQEKLARDIGEKVSVIHQIESKRLKPNFKIAKKLNTYLKINLIEKVEKVDLKKDKKDIDFKDKTLTIGDLLKKNE